MPNEDRSGWNASRPRSAGEAIKRGFAGRCPQCGEGKMFASFLKVRPSCTECGLNLDGHRADDMPPYITIMIVGHIVVPLMLLAENNFEWSLWLHAAIWLPLTLGLSLTIMQPVKGALIGYQWALKMHGFEPAAKEPAAAAPVLADHG